MKRNRSALEPGRGKLLDAWSPPEGAGEAVGCLATTFTFNAGFFEEECLGRFVGLESDATEQGAGYLIEREEKLSQLVCASVLVDQRHAQGVRSLRWDLMSIRIPKGILHAKVSLLLWTQAARIIVASANLTEDGYRRNHEVFGVLDFGPGNRVPREAAESIVLFLREVIEYAGIQDQARSPLGRAKSFLDLFRARVMDYARDGGRKARIHAILTGPGRPNFFEEMRTVWPSQVPPSDTWIISPFFDPPQAPNQPARTIWKSLRQRGRASVTYGLKGLPAEDQSKIQLEGPDSLQNGKPVSRPVVLNFEELKLDTSRNLHAKTYWFQDDNWVGFIMGSSNFTSAGMGLSKSPNFEANLAYVLNRTKERAAIRSCEQAWIIGHPVKGDFSLIPPPPSAEDCEDPNEFLLPKAFREAVLESDKLGRLQVRLSFIGQPPAGWAIFPDESEEVFTDESFLKGKGCPTQLVLPWKQQRPPSGFRVRVPGHSGSAWWALNIADPATLPAPETLRHLPLDVLIDILTSARPLHVVMRRFLRDQEKSQNPAGGPVQLDPLRRYQSSNALIHRTRRVSCALVALRQRLEDPVRSIQALDWRLHGPVGVSAVERAILKEAVNVEESCFLLAELLLELGRTKPTTTPGGPAVRDIRSKIGEVVQDLQNRLQTDLSKCSPALRKYIRAAIKSLS